MTSAEKTSRPYFRRDQRDGISPPDLSKECTFAEHIVHARGKRTQYTSVSLDPNKIKDFGDTTYRLKRQQTEADKHIVTEADKHIVIEHDSLLTELQRTIREQDKADRAKNIHQILSLLLAIVSVGSGKKYNGILLYLTLWESMSGKGIGPIMPQKLAR